jgi:hypothetical protein
MSHPEFLVRRLCHSATVLVLCCLIQGVSIGFSTYKDIAVSNHAINFAHAFLLYGLALCVSTLHRTTDGLETALSLAGWISKIVFFVGLVNQWVGVRMDTMLSGVDTLQQVYAVFYGVALFAEFLLIPVLLVVAHHVGGRPSHHQL